MYNNKIINSLVSQIKAYEGKGNKEFLTEKIVEQFGLQKPSKGAAIFCCDTFAIRFCSAKGKTDSVSNTVMKFAYCKEYDSIPLIVCVVGPTQTFMRLANATFIKKVSHSSLKLRVDNIRGNLNYPDIMKEYNGLENAPENFEQLFQMHSQIGFDNNLERIVEATKGISPTGKKFTPTPEQKQIILEAPQRTYDFVMSRSYNKLKKELNSKTKSAEPDILLVETYYKHDVKLRGNLVEFFIKSEDETRKNELREKIKNKEVIEEVTVENGLGDYSVVIDGYSVETDIKSKISSLNSAPKGYNVDKLLEFLSLPNSVYLLYIVSIDESGKTETELASIFQKQILDKTRIQHHWAGRNSRGVAQFDGHSLEYFEKNADFCIEIDNAKVFLETILEDSQEE